MTTTLKKFYSNIKSYNDKLTYSGLVIIISVLSFLYVLPILLTNTFYIDDMNRTTEGYNWHRDGRFVSSEIIHLLSFQKSVVFSGFPYSTILSALILSFSGCLLGYLLGVRDKIFLLISSLILLTCPFVLEILLYKFDCLPISLSILFIILPFIFYENKVRFLVASLLCLFLVFGLYQTTALCYAIILIFFTIYNLWNKAYKKLIINGFLGFISFLLAFVLSNLTIKVFKIQMVDQQRSEFVFKSNNYIELIKDRFYGFKGLFDTLSQTSYKYAIFLCLILSVVGLITFLLKRRWNVEIIVHLGITIILLFIVLVLAIGINLFVLEARWSPRSLIGYAFVTYILLFAVHQLPSKALFLGKLAFIPLIYYSFLISSQLGIFLKNQDEYSDFISSMIAPEVLKHKDLKLIIDGSIQYAPRNATVKNETMPFIYKLAPLYEHYEFYWGIIRMNKFGIMSNTYVFGEERTNVLSNKESFPTIQENKYYTLRIQPPYAVVTFH